MSAFHRWSTANRWSGAGVLGAFLVFGCIFWEGLLLQPPRMHLDPPRSATAGRDDFVIPIRARADADRLERLVIGIVDSDPFRADRHRPAGRYGAPTSPLEPPPSMGEPPPTPAPAPIRLLAIASSPRGRGIAALQASGAPTRIVHVGDSLAGMRVLSIRGDQVRLQGTDTVIVLRMTSSSSAQ